jgi:hypothetical protein
VLLQGGALLLPPFAASCFEIMRGMHAITAQPDAEAATRRRGRMTNDPKPALSI